jgi:hypothetical protein
VIVKVGGSLFDWPDLGPRLRCWLAQCGTSELVLVPGGGRTADVVRDLDRRHGLGDEAAHWLALRSLTVNALFLIELLREMSPVLVEHPRACADAWRHGRVPVLDGYAFARADEGSPGCLPHSWAATSDSLAARVAAVAEARRLMLLKSVSVPGSLAWSEAAKRGLVDGYFAETVGVSPAFEVRAVNLRAWQP